MTLVSAWLRIPFWQRVVAGFVLGAIAGAAMGPAAEVWFGPLGDLYVTLIKMIAVPLVFFAVINAISSLHGQKSVAALGGRTFLWFVITAALAVGVGLAVGTIMQPGAGHFSLSVDSAWKPRDVPSPIKVLLDVVPSNPFYALTGIGTKTNAAGETVLAAGRGSILPVIFFAALLGFAMVKLGDRVAEARKLTGQMSDIMIQVTRFVLEMTPLGTFGLIAGLVGSYGFAKLLPFGNFVLALYVACALHIVVVYSSLLLLHGLNPWKFFRGAALWHASGVRELVKLRRDASGDALDHPQPRREQGLRRLRRAAGREHQDGRLWRDLPGVVRRVHRAIHRRAVDRQPVFRGADRLGAGQLRYRWRAGHRGGDGHGGA